MAGLAQEEWAESGRIDPMAATFSVAQTAPVVPAETPVAALLVITLLVKMLLGTALAQAGVEPARARCRLTGVAVAAMASAIAASPAAADSVRAAARYSVTEDSAAAPLAQPAIAADTVWAAADSAGEVAGAAVSAGAAAVEECAAAADVADERRRERTTVMKMSGLSLTISVITAVSLLVGFEATVPALAQTPDSSPPEAAPGSFEELPELKASEILKPEYLKGPHHTIREPVPTSSGANQYVIDSDFGVFDADGNEMLVRRVKEVYAIAQLSDVSRTDQFKDSLVTAAKGPYNAAKNIVKDPVNSISNVPKGVMKFMGRAGDSVKNIGKKKESDPADGSKFEQTIGYSKAKRKIAVDMGIDPYSTNPVLQKQLNDVAWASWAGGFSFSAATLPIGGAAGIALTATNVTDSCNKMVQEKPPADLKQINRSALRSMGATANDTERFLSNSAFTPSQQTAFVFNLKALENVTNRGAFVRSAAEKSSTETDALFCLQTSMLLAQIHGSEHPLAHIAMIENFPVGIAKDGTVVVALQWDYAAWTPGAAFFAGEVQKLADQSGQKKSVLIALSGDTSPRLRDELQKRGFTVRDHLSPGPLK